MKKIILLFTVLLLLNGCDTDDLPEPLQALGSFIIDGELNFIDVLVGGSESSLISITNDSENPIEIYSISLPNNSFQVDWSNGFIGAGSTQFINVTFDPTEPESYSGTLTIENDTFTEGNSISINATAIENQNNNIEIGDFHEGGVVFYIDSFGHGLICSIYNDGNHKSWGPATDTGATGTEIGTGAGNTQIIVNNQYIFENSAAYICDNLDYFGFNDWYLPSKDELFLMYQQGYYIGNTSEENGGERLVYAGNTSSYWSSSESLVDIYKAESLHFSSGTQGTYSKDLPFRVRGIRSF